MKNTIEKELESMKRIVDFQIIRFKNESNVRREEVLKEAMEMITYHVMEIRDLLK